MNAMLIVSVCYIAAQMISDVASLQIVSLAGLSMDAGTLIYPITFTLRDLAHKVLGLKGVRLLIVLAGIVNLFMAGFFWLVTQLQPDYTAGSSQAWGQVLGPVWRITLASIFAEIASEFADTEVYRAWVDRITRRFQWMRVLVSNAVSVPIDSFLFVFLAFYGNMPVESVWKIFWANVLLKGAITIFSMPLVYVVKEKEI